MSATWALLVTIGCGGSNSGSAPPDNDAGKGSDGSAAMDASPPVDASPSTDASSAMDANVVPPVDGSAMCPAGLTMCGSTCTNVTFDPNNCGVCGKSCSVSQVCASGVCSTQCGAGQQTCATDGGSYCASTQTDNANCGGCGNVCPAGQVCGAGHCGAACGANETLCAPDGGAPYCASTQTDNANCGSCGNQCPAGEVCSSGQCGAACGANETLCPADGGAPYCATTQTDTANCGACGNACPTGQVCSGGKCSLVCVGGSTNCNGTCVQTQTDNANCGACGNACPAGDACKGGSCVLACNGLICGGQCVPTATDPNNCGGCGVVCSANNVSVVMCAGGVCDGPCTAPWLDCNGNKQTDGCEVNPQTNPDDCGGCGMACSVNHMATYTCTSGTCSGACATGYADCDDNKLTDGCETAIATDPANCGACAVSCSSNNMATVTCGNGACNGACDAGFADCNGNKQTDGCETDVGVDPNDCGGCNVTCSLNNMATVTCGAGTCNGTCAAPFLDCNGNKQTDGCEVDPQTNPNDCGGCGIACSSNGMATVACGNGVCDGTCAAGRADCNGNKQTDGCETSTSSDPNNCGACGTVCPSGYSCISGTCATCNANVLLLSDGNAMDTQIASALTAAGLVPTVVTNGAELYAATPAATTFGAILVLVGNDYPDDMNAAGQSAIVNAFDAGTGVVFTEWAAYEAYSGRWASLKSLLLATYTVGSASAQETYTLTSTGHPIWNGLAGTFTTAVSVSSADGTIINGGTRIATGAAGTTQVNGIVVKDVVGSSGRTVQIDHAANYDPNWTSDANLVKLLTNSAKWAAKCM